MKRSMLGAGLLCLCLGLCLAELEEKVLPARRFVCEKFEPNKCATEPCPFTETCEQIEGDAMTTACMAVWSNSSTEGVTVKNKGCWKTQNANDCPEENNCVARNPSQFNGDIHYFCCCVGNLCNSKLETLIQPKKITAPSTDPPPRETPAPGPFQSFFFVFIPIFLFAIAVFLAFFFYRRRRLQRLKREHMELGEEAGSDAGKRAIATQPHRNIQLHEEVAKGRFGVVYRGRLGETQVAVKVFPPQDWESWTEEQEIYAIPGMRNAPNILDFIGAETRGSGFAVEYWLITVYQDLGCLTDYLKKKTVSLREMMHISKGMLRGLAFLHEEMIGPQFSKPTIVHRDMKSRNVLLDSHLTARISDFGLAMKCEHGRTPEETHGQVGTRRYMAVEVLEGATEFSAFAFRQIDVYAAALVLWELASRTRIDNDEPEGYKLPYEEEAGLHPSLADMQEVVVKARKRPIIRPAFANNHTGSIVSETITEMWDTEPEARITAGCALERLDSLLPNGLDSSLSLSPSSDPVPPPPPPPPESSPLITQFRQ